MEVKMMILAGGNYEEGLSGRGERMTYGYELVSQTHKPSANLLHYLITPQQCRIVFTPKTNLCFELQLIQFQEQVSKHQHHQHHPQRSEESKLKNVSRLGEKDQIVHHRQFVAPPPPGHNGGHN